MIGVHCALESCKTLFEPRSGRQKYCTRECQRAVDNARARWRVGDRQAPAEAPDGPARLGPLTQLYEVKCLACSRSTFVELTPERAAALRAFPPCQDCQGTVHLEMVLMTSSRRVW